MDKTNEEAAATKDAYKKLEAAILTCSRVVGCVSTIDLQSTSTTNVHGDIGILDRDSETAIFNSTSGATTTTNRVVLSERR